MFISPISIYQTAGSAALLLLAIYYAPHDLRNPVRLILGSMAFAMAVVAQVQAESSSVLLKASLLSAALQVNTKVLDLIFMRRAAPVWQGKKPISRLGYASRLVFGLRYEHFDIYIPPAKSTGIRHDFFSGLISVFLIGTIIFLDGFPTTNSYTSSLVTLLCLHVSFSILSIFLEDPLTQHHPFLSESLSSFWTKGWHQLFSPGLKACAYDPVMRLTRSRGLGVLAGFVMSGVWHAIQLYPPGGREGALRTFGFFFFNGVGCIFDSGVLRRIPNKTARTVARRVFAWVVLWILAAWTARGWPGVQVFHKDFVELFHLPQNRFPFYTGYLHRHGLW